ncbi:phage protein Gp37 [Burkholderia cenocepacia]|uniref:phage protein Gp37 n=1 Tax=Burkholderia cenocepacia TaxID=95486 RepID=UPI0008472A36|nr:phage protein Gp37 [Burkholderia cenocepacia]
MDMNVMSMALLDALNAELRSKAGKLFKTVELYGGQFDAEEVPAHSFVAPAAFTACLGWRRLPKTGQYIGKNAWYARCAVFVVTKDANRVTRAASAMQRAELVSRILANWDRPPCTGKADNVVAENMYSRKFDAKGLAVWMVGWWQEIEFDGLLRHDELPGLATAEVHTKPTIRPPDPPPPTESIPNVQIEIEGVTNGPNQKRNDD